MRCFCVSGFWSGEKLRATRTTRNILCRQIRERRFLAEAEKCVVQLRSNTNNGLSSQCGRRAAPRDMKRDNFQEVAVVEGKYKFSRLIRGERKSMIPPSLECAVLATSERRGLFQVDALPDWDISHVWSTAAGTLHSFSKQPFLFLIIHTINIPLCIREKKGMRMASPSPLVSFRIYFWFLPSIHQARQLLRPSTSSIESQKPPD